MTLRLQNLMLAMLLALATLFAGLGALTQNPTSGGYQLFERAASGISADIQLVSLENFAPPPESASEYANAPNRTATQYPDGTFSVSDWTGYPSGVPRPPEGTTYRLLTGSEYTEARRLANNANAQLRRSGVVPEGHEIHEIVPVKYGGSPTDPANKVYLPRGVHRSEVTPWWNRLQRDLEQ